MSKALLIGAGFSIPLGMPSSAEFSKAFFTFLTPDRLKAIAGNCEAYESFSGDNVTDKATYDTLVGDFTDLYDNGNANYEAVIKAMAEKHPAKNCLIGKMKVLLNESFLIFQNYTHPVYEKNSEIIGRFLDKYAENGLFIFSLNHDVSVEMLCHDYAIDLYMGSADTVRFPHSNIDNSRHVTFQRRDNTERNILNLNFANNAKGINLLKLHGGINEFFSMIISGVFRCCLNKINQ